MKLFGLLSLLMVAHCLWGATPQRSYLISSPQTFTDTCLTFSPTGHEPYSAIEIRISVHEPRRLHTGHSPAWFEIACGNLRFIARRHAQVADNIHDGSTLQMLVYAGDSLLSSSPARGVKFDGAQNSYLLEWNESSDTLQIFSGHEKLSPALTVPIAAPTTNDPVNLYIIGTSSVAFLVTEEKEVPRERRLAGVSADSLAIITSPDPFAYPDGVYKYLDRATDPAIARPGGRYTIAVVKQPDSTETFAIYYIAGAEVDSSFWKPGMIKGSLKATPFKDQYDLEWYDAHGNTIPGASDSYAVTDRTAGTLTLTFPSLDGATLRFARTTSLPIMQEKK